MKVLGDDKKLWEDEVYKFARKHQLEVHVGQLTFSLTTILSFDSGLLRALVLVFYTFLHVLLSAGKRVAVLP